MKIIGLQSSCFHRVSSVFTEKQRCMRLISIFIRIYNQKIL